jgi:MerR family redox-sensitive transcriptional activator SoxR
LSELLSIGELAERTGVAITALRFYESKGLISPQRTDAGHRRYPRDALRRISFVLAAQRVGLSLADILGALDSLPHDRAPTAREWSRLARSWQPVLDERIALLQKLRNDLDDCIGCGCLSLATCALRNPDDVAHDSGTGPRYLLGQDPDTAR